MSMSNSLKVFDWPYSPNFISFAFLFPFFTSLLVCFDIKSKNVIIIVIVNFNIMM